jgi:hypothetical protein
MELRRTTIGSLEPVAWADPENDPIYAIAFPEILVQVIGVPSTPYVAKASLNNDTYVTVEVWNRQSKTFEATIAEAGFFSVPAQSWLKLVDGDGSQFLICSSS